MTLLQAIAEFVSRIKITPNQTDGVSTTYNNIKDLLLCADSGLKAECVFLNGSYARKTIIRPLDDVDIFLVLKREHYVDANGVLKNPQGILTKIKDYLNSTRDYKDKAKQDRPCVTVRLANIDFDILPCFGDDERGYEMPNHALTGWTMTNPVLLEKDLIEVNQKEGNGGYIRKLIRGVKQWNLENGKILPSFHLEEIAIDIFRSFDCPNLVEGVYKWFANAKTYLLLNRFDSVEDYNTAYDLIEDARKDIAEAYALYHDGKEGEATRLFKKVFGTKFPTVLLEEAKATNEQMKNGQLKMASNGFFNTAAATIAVKPTKYFGGSK